jgi:anhydro-N-acetylmuramic acid kinase
MQISSENKLHVIGLMSGTSLDGLDIADVKFDFSSPTIDWAVGASETIAYSNEMRARLQASTELSGLELRKLDVEFAQLCAIHVNKFVEQHSISPSFISSHGHTVFHQPANGFTLQIGCGATLASLTGINVVADFRQQDVALGGQGAPLVPIADAYLFRRYDVRINLGGFANYSLGQHHDLVAGDICPLNCVLNELCKPLQILFDKGGEIARSGKMIPSLFEKLQTIEWYALKGPKSLGIEWVRTHIFPLLDAYKEMQTADVIHTFTLHAANQIARLIPPFAQSVLLSGGGTHNTFLVEQIQQQSKADIVIPTEQIIDFKEAISFALLGALRVRNEVNVHRTVTGSLKNLRAGAIYLSTN